MGCSSVACPNSMAFETTASARWHFARWVRCVVPVLHCCLAAQHHGFCGRQDWFMSACTPRRACQLWPMAARQPALHPLHLCVQRRCSRPSLSALICAALQALVTAAAARARTTRRSWRRASSTWTPTSRRPSRTPASPPPRPPSRVSFAGCRWCCALGLQIVWHLCVLLLVHDGERTAVAGCSAAMRPRVRALRPRKRVCLALQPCRTQSATWLTACKAAHFARIVCSRRRGHGARGRSRRGRPKRRTPWPVGSQCAARSHCGW